MSVVMVVWLKISIPDLVEKYKSVDPEYGAGLRICSSHPVVNRNVPPS